MNNPQKRKPDLILTIVGEPVCGVLYIDQKNRHIIVEEQGEKGFSIFSASPDFGEALYPLKEGRLVQIGSRFYVTVESGYMEETPESVAANPRIPTPDEAFRCELLGRLQSDCVVYLGQEHKNVKRLWAGDVKEQIAKMRELWNSLPDDARPKQLTWEQIQKYEDQMTTEL